MVVSYSSIICQLSKLNMERRNLTSYRYTNNLNTELVTSRQEVESVTMTESTKDSSNVDNGVDKSRGSWSIYFKNRSCRSYSFKENPSVDRFTRQQRRLSDFIGLQNINVS